MMSIECPGPVTAHPPPLQKGDVLLFIFRPYPLSTALSILRDGVPLPQESPAGLVPARSLGSRLKQFECEAHALVFATTFGLMIGPSYESEEGLHVPVQ